MNAWRTLVCSGLILLGSIPGMAQDRVPETEPESLRNWFLEVQWVGSEREKYDVFARENVPPAEVTKSGEGPGFSFGRRIGGRFVLAFQFLLVWHDVAVDGMDLIDGEMLITGTVLFRERSFLQPFLRGGVGGTGLILKQEDDVHIVYGTAASAGGGLALRLSGRWSLELEGAGTFANYLEADENPADEEQDRYQVRTSNIGWRLGVGIRIWF